MFHRRYIFTHGCLVAFLFPVSSYFSAGQTIISFHKPRQLWKPTLCNQNKQCQRYKGRCHSPAPTLSDLDYCDLTPLTVPSPNVGSFSFRVSQPDAVWISVNQYGPVQVVQVEYIVHVCTNVPIYIYTYIVFWGVVNIYKYTHICIHIYFYMCTPRKTNIPAEKFDGLENYCPFWTGPFWGDVWIPWESSCFSCFFWYTYHTLKIPWSTSPNVMLHINLSTTFWVVCVNMLINKTHLAVLDPEIKPFERLIFPTKYACIPQKFQV